MAVGVLGGVLVDVAVEVAVVAEVGLEGVVDGAVEIDVLEVGVGATEHRPVFGDGHHHHRQVLAGQDVRWNCRHRLATGQARPSPSARAISVISRATL